MTIYRILLRATVALPLLALGSVAVAQAPAPAKPAADPNEIIVTAAKRSENLQSVPISVSAITGDALSKGRVTQVDDLVTKVPNLQLTSTVGDNTPIFALRGVSMSDYSLNQASPVATYYDEVYKGNFALLGVALFDLERVEVLRGPQGTLYGKNTTGGAVNLISRAPKLHDASGYLNVGYGNYNRTDLNGAVNIPLGDTLALRVAGTFARANGWFKNVLPGKPDLASVREYGVRGSLLFEPSAGVRFILRAATSYQNPHNYGIYAQPEAVVRPGLGRRQIAANVTDRRIAKTTSVSLTGNIDVARGLTLTSITSWDKGKLHFFEDTDGQSIHLLEIPYVDRATQIAQDLRLTSNFDGSLNFIIGAYYNREKVFNRTTFEIGANPGLTANDCAIGYPFGCLFDNSFDQLKKSYAAYTDLNYKLADRLTLRGGVRFTHDTGQQTNFRSDALGPDQVLVANLIPLSSLRFKTNNVSGKVGVDYKLGHGNMVYANYSRGYRARSFNAQAFFDPSELSVAKPEAVDAYEVGAKTQFLDRRVTLNLAAFYYGYKNQQFINISPITGAQTLENIPKSRIMGGEAELTARVSQALTLRAGLGLLDAKIRKGIVSGIDVAGHTLSNAPKLTFDGGIDATLVDGLAGKVSAHADVAYASSQYFEVINIPRLQQKAYALLSGHLDWESRNHRFNASLWGKNLTDHFYFTSRVDLLAGFGFDYNHVSTPRTYGVTAGVKF